MTGSGHLSAKRLTEDGLSASLQVGLAALNGARRVLVALGDAPEITCELIERLQRAGAVAIECGDLTLGRDVDTAADLEAIRAGARLRRAACLLPAT